jgi:hypothetical protein
VKRLFFRDCNELAPLAVSVGNFAVPTGLKLPEFCVDERQITLHSTVCISRGIDVALRVPQ